MRFFALDTSGSVAHMAAGDWRDRPASWAEECCQCPAGHNEEIAGASRRLIERVHGKLAALEVLIIGEGPGSFTGLRVGFSLMKGLALGLDIPLCSVSSLKAMAEGQHGDKELIVALTDAGRREAFFAAYRRDATGELEDVAAARIVPIEALAREIMSLEHALGSKAILVGWLDGVSRPMVAAKGVAASLAVLAVKQCSTIELELPELARMTPNYVRAVNARTIAERSSLGNDVGRRPGSKVPGQGG